MSDLVVQVLGALLLIGLLAAGWRWWVRPRAVALSPYAAGLFLLIALTMLGGLVGAPAWWFAPARSFSWPLPALAGRMLASAGVAFAVAGAGTLARPDVARVRLFLAMLATYLLPLVIAILLFHLKRFDFSAPITYAFFALAGGMALACAVYLLRQPALEPARRPAAQRPPRPMAAWLLLVIAVAGAWGLALFLNDHGPAAWVWLWPGDLLTSRLIGVMLVTLAVGALVSLGSAEAATLMLVVLLTYGAGSALANYWNAASGRPLKPAYLIAFAVLAAGSAALLLGTPWLNKLRGTT